MSRKRAFAIVAMAVLGAQVTSGARAADIDATLAIDQVLVYPNSAEIVRRGEITVPPGTHRLVMHGLPDPIDAGTLRVSAESRNVRLGGIEIERIIDTEFVSDAERTLRRKLTELEDRRVALQDEIPTAQTQLKMLDTIAGVPMDRDGRAIMDVSALPATLNAMGTSASIARGKIRAANIAIRSLDDEITATRAELDKVVTARKSTSEVRAFVEAAAAVTVPVTIVYRVNDAGWDWLYEARLDTQSKRLALYRQASIKQGSGEDWQNAEVSVTTAKPRPDAGGPPVTSLFLSLSGPNEEEIVTASRRTFADDDDDGDDEAPVITAGEFATEFVAEYRIPGRVTIPANRQTRLYPISEESFEAELVARAVMPVEPAARLEATFTYKRDTPNEPGPVQLYRDGAYVGAAALPILLPGSGVRIPFGIDDRIRIKVRDERAESGRRGLANRQILSEHRRRFEVTSFHAAALPLEIIDRVPVPKDSDIRVEVLRGATAPAVKDVDGKAGVYLWRFDGTPRKTETIRHYYSVRYPGDRKLGLSEQGD